MADNLTSRASVGALDNTLINDSDRISEPTFQFSLSRIRTDYETNDHIVISHQTCHLSYVSLTGLLMALHNVPDEEARAEVEVLTSKLDKTNGISRKIQVSLNILEQTGRNIDNAIGPVFDSTRRLQTFNQNVDNAIGVLHRFQLPNDIFKERPIITGGVEKAGLSNYLMSLSKVNRTLADLRIQNLKTHKGPILDLDSMSKFGTDELVKLFSRILRQDDRPIEPLHFIAKDLPFPSLTSDRTTRLGPINDFVASSAQMGANHQVMDTQTVNMYANIRGTYIANTLRNLSVATMNTARKQATTAVYRKGINGMSTYLIGIEGTFVAEHENITIIFRREQWSRVFSLTCQPALAEFSKITKELNSHIKKHLTTDAPLAFELMEILSTMADGIGRRTGHHRDFFLNEMMPFRATAKTALPELIDDIRRTINQIIMFPADGATLPLVGITMGRLESLCDLAPAVSSILVSIGDGKWNHVAPPEDLDEQMAAMRTFDPTMDGQKLFNSYCRDTFDTLVTMLDSRARTIIKNRTTLGVFLGNTAAVIARSMAGTANVGAATNAATRSAELSPLLARALGAEAHATLEGLRKRAISLYLEAWKEPSAQLLDVQYTNRSGASGQSGGGGGAAGASRPASGSATAVDSAAIVKALGSRDRDNIKEKFRAFNAAFDELAARHRALAMEPETRDLLARQVQQMIEPLYGRFWDRYHEIDKAKSKGKYVKYDKASFAAVFASMS